MTEFTPDEESVSRAEIVSSQLMKDLRETTQSSSPSDIRRELFSVRRYADQAGDVPIGDVVANIGQMATEFALARRWDGEIPCMRLDGGEIVPISISAFFEGPFPGFYSSTSFMEFLERYGPFPFPIHRYLKELIRHEDSEDNNVLLSHVEEAEERAQPSLAKFLSYRFAGMKRWAEWIHGKDTADSNTQKTSGSSAAAPPPKPPAVGAAGALQVQVSCSTPGLRIHVSPAYFINWVFFGSPTTPVTGYVSPGRYVFAGDGPMLPRRTKDNGVFCIPPNYYPSLAKF